MLDFKIRERFGIRQSDIVVIYKSYKDYYVQGEDCRIIQDIIGMRPLFNDAIDDYETRFSRQYFDSIRKKLDALQIRNMMIEVDMHVYRINGYRTYHDALRNRKLSIADPQVKGEMARRSHSREFDKIPNHILNQDLPGKRLSDYGETANQNKESADKTAESQLTMEKNSRTCMLSYNGICTGMGDCADCEDYKPKFELSSDELRSMKRRRVAG